KGKKAAGEAGTNYQRLAKQLGAKTVNYNNVSNDVYLKDVEAGKTDLIMNDYYLQKLALAAVPNNTLKIMPNMYFTTNEDGKGVGILMKKGNTKLQKQVDKALKELKKDGTLKKLSEKYYHADVTKQPHVHISKTFTIK
ncbi:transporter substrate-binding domain-containing protein, partial [Lactobacillus parabuchneri]|nr:transporter substrate-binding domain-containing protein [Lentilactobacillus parabuchneri]